MDNKDMLKKLLRYFMDENPRYRGVSLPAREIEQFNILRSLMNIREAKPVDSSLLELQNSYLQEEIKIRGINDIADFSPISENLYLWRGDITSLRVDAIVNAANSGMLGCFVPNHACIDNAIHTFAGVQLRLDCADFMKKQGHPEPTGQAKITKAYNLPSKYVIHTVGPIIHGKLTQTDCDMLVSCYRSCLELAEKHDIRSIAFCCISTGEFHFPNEKAAEIAIQTVTKYIAEKQSKVKVIFNVFKEIDYEIYNRLLGADK